jgi:phosphate:Na+ symporter
MKVMSQGLQKVSGEGLRALIRNMTQNRFAGILTGTLVTTMVQSSSASTVMIVSFVNARLLTLKESIGMIMGCNLGTTTTFWLVAFVGFKFSLSTIALPCVGIGVILLFTKLPKMRDSGEALIGFGILFLGLSFLKDSVPDVKSNSEMFAFLADWQNYGTGSFFLFIAFGVILTIVVQSSSVAGAITLTLAAKGWIDYESAAAIVLGENIGTTITANLAALTANVPAKRAARAHLMFNLIGVLWMVFLFVPFTILVDFLTPGVADDPIHTLYHLAVFHSLFNFANICILVSFVPHLAKLSKKMVPSKGKDEDEDFDHLQIYSTNLPKTGEINIALAEQEVRLMAELTQTMFKGFNEVFENPETDMTESVRELKALEEKSDRMAFEITQYLIFCASSELSRDRLNEVTVLLRVVAELEQIGDCAYQLVQLAKRKYRKNQVMPPATQAAIREFCGRVDHFISFYINHLDAAIQVSDMETALQLEKTIGGSRKKLRKEAVRRMKDPANIKSEMLYIEILNQIERIGDHSLNILELLSQKD